MNKKIAIIINNVDQIFELNKSYQHISGHLPKHPDCLSTTENNYFGINENNRWFNIWSCDIENYTVLTFEEWKLMRNLSNDY